MSRLKVLHVDIETRKIGFFRGGHFNPDGCEPLVIALSWADEDEVRSWVQKPDEYDSRRLLAHAIPIIRSADILSGHYITKFDLPILNGALLEMGMPLLPDITTSDTKTHLVRVAGISLSQENLSAMKRLEEGKLHMSDVDWRAATRKTPAGLKEMRNRCVDDVIQQKALRRRLIEAGALKAPKVWRP